MATTTATTPDASPSPNTASLSPIQLVALTSAVVFTVAGLIYAIMFAMSHWTPLASATVSRDVVSHARILYVVCVVAAAISPLVTSWAAISCDPAQPDRMRQTWMRIGTGLACAVLAYVALHLVAGLAESPEPPHGLSSTSFDMLKN